VFVFIATIAFGINEDFGCIKLIGADSAGATGYGMVWYSRV